jgi:hypothetical protein
MSRYEERRLRRKVKELEDRVRLLEARPPAVVWPVYVAPCLLPYYPQMVPRPGPHYPQIVPTPFWQIEPTTTPNTWTVGTSDAPNLDNVTVTMAVV